jgi:hypothetical protein
MTPTQSPTLASQATAELPKLPPHVGEESHGPSQSPVKLYDADQMRAFYELGRASRAQSEWQTPPASWRLLAKAAIELLCAIDAKHDTERPPTKYSVPYGAVNQLRSALGCAEDQPATFGETK